MRTSKAPKASVETATATTMAADKYAPKASVKTAQPAIEVMDDFFQDEIDNEIASQIHLIPSATTPSKIISANNTVSLSLSDCQPEVRLTNFTPRLEEEAKWWASALHDLKKDVQYVEEDTVHLKSIRRNTLKELQTFNVPPPTLACAETATPTSTLVQEKY